MSLHILDIAENSIAAGADTIEIVVSEDTKDDRLRLQVKDNGRGMDAELIERVTDPFVTSRTTRKVGLGIPLLKAAAEACDGWLTIQSEPGKGACVEVEFQRSHIDRMPLGDIATTLLNLVVTNPQIRWLFSYQVDQDAFKFDSQPIRRELGDIPLSEPVVLAFLRELISTGVSNVQPSEDAAGQRLNL
ncbi:MAG TPA: ATP-binding protein [Anaerolineaceae bacterium]|nr:ATP-binding protein [Anaerolineaceae bacterium]